MARKILLADDSVTAQNMGRKILTDAGYEVATVNNGSAALKKITDAKPDLIVLDVYMPGYSGLEVCQRIKETRETAHIPVLLTVGKLEPFKQEEARRVRADAFIVKPFEASELLAALGKLEDKLPPPERSRDSHHSASTMASFERLISESAPKYGDEESGWKARLKIPKGEPKEPGHEAEPEPAPNASGFHASSQEEISSPPVEAGAPAIPFLQRPIPAGLPQDITPDEIAAISAAAARVSLGLSVGKEFERMASQVHAAEKETEIPEAKASQTAPEELATQAATAPEIESHPEPEERAAAELKQAKAPEIPQDQRESAIEPPPKHAEVEAALASIETGNARRASAELPGPAAEKAAPEPVPVAVAAGEAVTMAGASRWIAEEIPVEAQESVLLLEREMQKAYAAFAAAEHAASQSEEPAPVDRDDEPMFATMAPPAIGSPVPEAAQTTAQEEPSEPAPAAPAFADGFPETQRPPAPPFPAATSSLDESQHAVAAFGGPQPFGGPEPKEETVSASSAAGPTKETGSSPESGSLQEAEFANAGAWASWTEIREKLGSAGEREKGLEEQNVAEGAKQEEAPAPEKAARAAAAAGDTPSSTEANLSSIVDSMLAELKPRLMAELAKKLEKKKE